MICELTNACFFLYFILPRYHNFCANIPKLNSQIEMDTDMFFIEFLHWVMLDITRDQGSLVDDAGGGNKAIIQFQAMTLGLPP